MIRPVLHIVLHLLVPGVVARGAFAEKWKQAWGIMILTMIIDADHLLADPVYDPDRCGIGFHPLHSFAAIAVYVLLALPAKTRVVGIGLLIHMALDGLDCIWMG
jgi:hypothetical protein